MCYIYIPIMSTTGFYRIGFAFALFAILSEAFFRVSTIHRSVGRQVYMSKKPQLDPSTLWQVNLKLQKSGFKDVSACIRIRFIEDKGYEPPQGKIYIETDLSGIVKCDEKGIGGRYTLSEDKDDRKDGLWIWGLFEEPKYPFLYMNMDVYNSTVLPSGEEEPIFGGTGLPNGRLYIRFSHQLVKEIGVVLTAPQMNYKETEIVKADILGIVQFDAGEYKPAGSIEVFPLLNNPASSGGEASDNRTAANATPLQLQVRDFNPSKDSAL